MEPIRVEPHPLLRCTVFMTTFPAPLGQLRAPDWLSELRSLDAAAPVSRSEDVRAAVRDMLRHGGYKPTGRGKPASEYLLRAASEAGLPSINVAVDACNVVSLHSGLPISVVDLDRVHRPLRIGVAGAGDHYVFNAAGQEIDLEGLVCLFDAEGPCANAVKDSQRTKTGDATLRTLSIVWGCTGHEAHLTAATEWYREILARAGARTVDVPVTGG